MSYELYGHGGVGIIAEVMTDNKNRISSDMRIATNKKGGTVAMPGAVAFNFERQGIIQIPRNDAREEEIFLAVSEAGAEDFETEGDFFIVTTPPDLLYQVKEKLDQMKVACEETSLEMVPKVWVECNEEDFKANEELIAWLENLDDVDAVYHNMQPLKQENGDTP